MNKNLFSTKKEIKNLITNNSGGIAYGLSDQEALAQLVCTGTLSDTFYSSAETQVNDILSRTQKCKPEFLQKLAVYARKESFMKDTPALLVASLFAKNSVLAEQIFDRAIDNGRMLRNFCQIVRSGVTGRSSFGTVGKRMIRNWINNRSLVALFNDDVGNDPSLADIIKMVHPKGEDAVREAFYGYLIGKVEGSDSRLPKFVKEFEAFKSGKENKRTLPDSKIDFRRFTALNLSEKEWKEIGSKMGWQALRMNLNTLARHNAFSDKEFAKFVVDKLKNKEDILKSRVFPYQLMTAYLNVDSSVPTSVANSLQDAMEIATENVPSFDGKKVIVAIDSSGSMGSPITGLRAGGVASKVTCNQVASLIAACLLRKNEDNCTIMRFDTSAEILKLNSRDSIMTLASKINRSGGGTACSTPIALANSKNLKADLFILLSDNESWADRTNYWGGNATGVMEEWTKFKKQNPNAKLVCIDLTPNTTTQATSAKDRLNVGGFNDSVFEVMNTFVHAKSSWVDVIEKYDIGK